MEPTVLESLKSLMDAAKRGDGVRLAEEMARLDRRVAEGRSGMDPRLAHFLERRSYAKALELLGGSPVAAGTCGGRPKDR